MSREGKKQLSVGKITFINSNTDFKDPLYVVVKKGKFFQTIDDYFPVLIDVDKKGQVLGVEFLQYETIEDC